MDGMEHKSVEDSRTLERIKTDMFMYKIMYLPLEKMVKTNSFECGLKEKLLFLINPITKQNLSELEICPSDESGFSSNHLSSNSDHPTEKELVYMLGLSPDIISQLNTPCFTPSELLLIKDVYFKQLSKNLKELSENVIGVETFEEDLELVKDIHKLVVDNNSESANIVQLQNNLIKLKYETIPGNELKKIKNYEKQKLKEILQLASDLHEETLNIIYPSEDFKVKMKEEVCSLKEELLGMNESIEELSRKKEMYQKVEKELMNIVTEFKEIKNKKRMVEMTLGEIKPFRS